MTFQYLSQAKIVQDLLEAATNVLPFLTDEDVKTPLLEALSAFETAITPSAIFLSEIYEWSDSLGVEIEKNKAVTLLENAALDIDESYVTESIIQQINELKNI
jgi:hypothetical protein